MWEKRADKTVKKAHEKEHAIAHHRNLAQRFREAGQLDEARKWEENAEYEQEELDRLLVVSDEEIHRQSGGEVLVDGHPDKRARRNSARLIDTLSSPNRTPIDASRARLELAGDTGCLAMALDLAETVEASNSLEKMICHQAAAAHSASMRLMTKGLELLENKDPDNGKRDLPAEATRMFNTAAKLMAVFQGAAQTLGKMRTGGRQEVLVQHVQVNHGGQAVVAGQVGPGGTKKTKGGPG